MYRHIKLSSWTECSPTHVTVYAETMPGYWGELGHICLLEKEGHKTNLYAESHTFGVHRIDFDEISIQAIWEGIRWIAQNTDEPETPLTYDDIEIVECSNRQDRLKTFAEMEKI